MCRDRTTRYDGTDFSGATIAFDRLPIVLAHESRLLQVFQNLIGNALKYIRISAERAGAYWRIAIRDDGIGIAPEHHEKIFGLFQRLHSRSEYPGTGIGLASCKRIIEHEGGRIWVESSVGAGSTFYFTLPAADAGRSDEPRMATIDESV
jgi:signal transduction histidine kinase